MKLLLDWVQFEYDPKMDIMDFIRNNEIDDSLLQDHSGRLKEIMVDLYRIFLDENY